MKLANEIWNKHIEVFDSFDLVCHNGNSLEEETRSTALFSAIVTLESMYRLKTFQREGIRTAINYLKGSKYYSEANKDSKY